MNELLIAGMEVAQVRIARPTHQLEAVVAFYRDALGLPELSRFANHDGYDGVVLGLPDKTYHLEFTQRRSDTPFRAPSADHLLVLFVPDGTQLSVLCERLAIQGHLPVAPENPHWNDKSLTFEDPDGWRVVLCNTRGI